MYMPNRYRLLILFIIVIFVFPFFSYAQSYSDGSLLRAEDDTKVYAIHNQKKRWIQSVEIFNSYNFKWQNIKTISENDLAGIEENQLIRLKGDAKVYLIDENGARKHIKSVEEFNAQGFDWVDIVEVNEKDFNSYEEEVIPTAPVSPLPSLSPSPLAPTPVPAEINLKLPSPDYIRADWLVSQSTSKYGLIGQRITFKYSSEVIDRIENFRLYEKKPGDQYFSKIAEFEEMLSTGCEDIDIDGEWMMTEAAPGQCEYWAIQKVVPPGGRDAVAYLSAANYSEGEYSYYVVGADKDGLETLPSPETKLVFLTTIGIFSPADSEQSNEAYPSFEWSVASDWPADSTADYLILISDDENAQNPFWARALKVLAGKSDASFVYNGSRLNPAKKYKLYIYGHYRQTEHDPDYISIPLTIPEFWIKSSGWSALLGFLKAFFWESFRLIR